MKIRYLGHACFTLEDQSKTIIIDPFLTGNPVAAEKSDSIKADLILVTHGHSDHLGDALFLSKKLGTPIFTTYELSVRLEKDGAKAVGGNHGGTYDFGFAKVKITWAVHSSSYGESLNVAGNPCGFVIKMGGKNIYHAGDTDVFYDMKLIGERNNLDVALLPIGGFYTMDSHDAIYAVEYLQPKIVIPMHYNTFPIIKADAMEFKKNVETKTKAKCIILKPGEFLEL
ncbi:metal-dependent hydrolase [Candidatus Marsarchaeota G2 archaeon ECH_B_SAG-F08]|uniref:UPF0173 metal-dependent hydrolase B9Q02_01165 n=6 Tax=Candidatus Marsarchaeota TaxID=1978152 RepID=A0A2R6AKF7_9ARCH|nr:MAG: metal-dependent hydrolase [Candidatus Marsarchaeota G1 archaeon OSP_D]PSN86823.1 MAG: metal-dependent hydrolase [Candidatus Marsarchaeota G1 archaeon BE_D]PSN88041.1 MAG: metal-dependent hydrolase [Candidatus Marsarchaeota G1 archaeon OSP_C]PSN97246.1 MAG: metal-dependent hydrolase [Candidatus Marsarchaeota G2 archaeon ECH_B_SAG-F08]PSO05964.1 MAG: metal-dependent hydrolase [Candidatus Marsarchaeota G2 archaeon ECH_B_SAG-G16]